MRDAEAMQPRHSSGDVGTEPDLAGGVLGYVPFPETLKDERAAYKAVQAHNTRRASREVYGTRLSKELAMGLFRVSRMRIKGGLNGDGKRAEVRMRVGGLESYRMRAVQHACVDGAEGARAQNYGTWWVGVRVREQFDSGRVDCRCLPTTRHDVGDGVVTVGDGDGGGR